MTTLIAIVKFLFEAIVVVGLLDFILNVVRFLKIKASTESQKKALADVEAAVSAAEQLYAVGEDKKAYVEQLLTHMGYEIDDIINMMIESCVNNLNSGIILDSSDEDDDEIDVDYEE